MKIPTITTNLCVLFVDIIAKVFQKITQVNGGGDGDAFGRNFVGIHAVWVGIVTKKDHINVMRQIHIQHTLCNLVDV